ncbi:hypothetical protein XH96_32385 [Bradyrhizobium sp. CCBAU 51765]|nr:hypothetical protein XH96_32385 [Bradyrhizobium sp. CCBAU 51765]
MAHLIIVVRSGSLMHGLKTWCIHTPSLVGGFVTPMAVVVHFEIVQLDVRGVSTLSRDFLA